MIEEITKNIFNMCKDLKISSRYNFGNLWFSSYEIISEQNKEALLCIPYNRYCEFDESIILDLFFEDLKKISYDAFKKILELFETNEDMSKYILYSEKKVFSQYSSQKMLFIKRKDWEIEWPVDNTISRSFDE